VIWVIRKSAKTRIKKEIKIRKRTNRRKRKARRARVFLIPQTMTQAAVRPALCLMINARRRRNKRR
jgi:hypothetical protein